MLSDEKDIFGMRKAKVDWRIADVERKTARYLGSLISDELFAMGLGRPIPSAWLDSEQPVRDGDLVGTYHHIGTTRMSKSPHDGVVNENCQSHGVDNLFIAGCSVFPTGGHANPTLTIVALAVRLADHIRSRLGE
jgi:choline dehydrogenase-like flavoprotein